MKTTVMAELNIDDLKFLLDAVSEYSDNHENSKYIQKTADLIKHELYKKVDELFK